MSHPLLSAFRALPDVRHVLDQVDRARLVDISASDGTRPFLVAALARKVDEATAGQPASGAGTVPGPAPVVVVTATTREAEDLASALGAFLTPDRIAGFPSWETLPHERLSPRSDTVGRRLAVLRRLAHPEPGDPAYGPLSVVVAPVRAILQPLTKGLGDLVPVALRAGDESPLEDVVDALVAAAYTRTDLVERRGEFAVRGGILDVFPPTEEHPVRIEFWGDTVEEVRWFKVADQRSLEIADHGLWAPPCRELLLTDDVRARARALADQLPGVAEMLSKVAEGIAVEGMESLPPALVDGVESVRDVLPKRAIVLLADPERIRRRAQDLVATSEEFLEASWANAAAGNHVPVDLQSLLGSASYWSLADVRALAERLRLAWWTLTPFVTDADLVIEDDDVDERIALHTVDADAFRGDTDRAVEHLRERVRDGWAVAVVTEGPGLAKRVGEVLRENDVPVRSLDPAAGESLQTGFVSVTCAPLGRGFVHEGGRIEVITETDLTGQPGSGTSTKDMRRMPSRRRNQVDPLQLRPGDHVVHEQHGVGRFVEMMQRTVAGATREYLVIEYAPGKRGQPGDRLFVPTDQLDQVTKYVGGEEPTLNKMGGSDWTKTKSRAKRYVKQIAADLIRLYSARQATKGHAFAADTPWQRELEDAFGYVETPDQLVSIDEVKADMEKQVPMDRLICGDVGYGKTEIAVRAAFKAIQDGKQVAVLVPTTLLVSQHQQTFAERYSQFPVKVSSLSRFQRDKEAKDVMAGMADGTIDLVIGTHRLLAKDTKFKDLGLVIIDEEQRLGVEHKELLKTMRTAVDVLSMSATPIPRTLEMAVTGIREMSTLATPPEERHPVLTFVGAYDEKQISAAIRRELLREGQVFYVHNKVDSIERTASRLMELVPEARVAVAHGKMNEHQLEQVIVDFWEKRFDVLVCTTIVETGLDISNANTLILERADLLGLSQLHQLRGRVGRGRERAYSYFLYPPEKPLTETAHDRLQTIAANTDLGAGMAVAMKDLEIRGAGNLLGGEQSGHIEGVGFDLYIRMVGEAVASFRGDVPEELPDVTIELPVDAHLPHDYIAHERLRLEAYRKIAASVDSAALGEVRAELVDRYGAVPAAVDNLFEVAEFRLHVRASGISDVTAQGKFVRFAPVELPESAQLRLKRLYPGAVLKPAVRTVLVPWPMTARIGGKPVQGREVMLWARQFIDAVVRGDVSAAATVGSSRG